MKYTQNEVLRFVEENDVKFIRLAFCDMFGTQKNISVMPGELKRVFETGFSISAKVLGGALGESGGTLFLHPDPATLSILPWRPSHGRVIRLFCDIRERDGSAYAGDFRQLLKQATAAALSAGYSCKVGSECEFYLFKMDDNEQPTLIPHDRGTCCDISPLDKGENVRREICLTLEQMGILPESSHHEGGPGQNEIVFCHGDALQAADQFITFRSVVKSISANNGLFASFMPKPLPNESGSGYHINLSFFRDGMNQFSEKLASKKEPLTGVAAAFTAGILDKIPEITAFMNPIVNSYDRFGSFEAPKCVTWTCETRSRLVRLTSAGGDRKHLEVRSADPSCNPHLVFALLIQAGLDGIRKKTPLQKPAETSEDKNPACLPASLEEALELAGQSGFVKKIIPEKALDRYLELKRAECADCAASKSNEAFYRTVYFPAI